MGDKKRKSFSLDGENAEFLSDQDNASALVNRLVEQYRQGADKQTVGLQLQLQQKRREREEAERRYNRLEEDVSELQQLIHDVKDHDDSQLEDAREALANTPRDASNPAVEKWASKLDITPTELVRKLDE